MDSLSYNQAETRRLTTKNAHLKTCRWLLRYSDYQDWLDQNKTSKNHGFLWIKGKPGTGKSTVVKFALMHVEKTLSKESTSISFLFNARGTELEKSTIGMYRSLLFQLLQKLPRLRNALELLNPPANLPATSVRWDFEMSAEILIEPSQLDDLTLYACQISAMRRKKL